MIKIHDKLWYIHGRTIEDGSEEETTRELAYMTYYEDNKAFEKRCYTGCDWASRRGYLYKEDGFIVDNVPLSGFTVVGSVSRWATSNKLFRIKDPRGFVVEIPSGNLATLLNYTIVIHGVVQEKCVWGRDKHNHVLLPVNSEPYLDTLKKMDVLENKLIKPRDLTPGDIVKIFGEDKYSWYDTCFVGRCRLTWQNTRTKEKVVDRWSWLFLTMYKSGGQYIGSENPKIEAVIENRPLDEISLSGFPPDRVLNKFTETRREVERQSKYYFNRTSYVEDSVVLIRVETKSGVDLKINHV